MTTNPVKIIDEIVSSAVDLSNHIVTEIFPGLSPEEHQAEVAKVPGSDPRIVLVEMVWDRLGEQGLLVPGWELQAGFVGSQAHKWLQRTHVDIQRDPLPLRWIVDTAPIEVMQPVIIISPNSPFQLLYRAGNAGLNNADGVGQEASER